MTISPAPLPRADRPMYFAGQLLTADDLTASQDVDSGLRRLHHRMLHGWGIAFGLVVTGRRGATAVTVSHGYALDCTGLELVLPDAVEVPVPPVAGAPDGTPRAFTLVVRATTDDDAIVELRASDCGGAGAVRRSDLPTLAWVDPVAVRTGYDVVLCEVLVQACVLSATPVQSFRRLLNPPPTPYVSDGRTLADETEWEVVSPYGAGAWAVRAAVDTAEAGFGDTPAYLARIQGRRQLTAAESPTGGPVLIDGVPHIEAAEPGRFHVVVPLLSATISSANVSIAVNPASVLASGTLGTLLTHTLKWTVEWIGVRS